jgi:hypothetical protein
MLVNILKQQCKNLPNLMMQLKQFLCKLNTNDHNQQKSNKKIDGFPSQGRQKGKAKERPKDAQFVGT